MHELPFAKSIFLSVKQKAEANNAKAVRLVVVEVGALRDFVPDIVQKYWRYVSKGSLAEGSEIVLREIPAVARCRQCGREYTIDVHNITATRCPDCGHEFGTLLSGRELRIVGIEITE